MRQALMILGAGALLLAAAVPGRAAIVMPREPDGWDRIVRIDTTEVWGQDARLEISLGGTGVASVVGIDAAW